MMLLFEYLRNLGYKIPNQFTFYSTRMMLAALTSLLISIFIGPLFIKKLYELKIGQTIRTSECPLLGKLHHNKQDTPTMGGILILISIFVSLFLWMDLKHSFTLLLFITTLFLGVLGGRDDYLKLRYKNTKGLSGKKKILGQVFISIMIALYLLVPSVNQFFHFGEWFQTTIDELHGAIFIPFMNDPIIILKGPFLIFSAFLIIFTITGSSNAVNLTDGLDGLASGCLIVASSCLAIIAFVSNHVDIARYLQIPYIEGSGEIAIFLSAFAGGCLGFLWYNGFPAQVFMGDIGSLSLGGALGLCAVLLKREFLYGIIGGIFVLEALSVIIQVLSFKFRNKKRVFLCSPLHHHFEYKGWPEMKVVLRFWIIGFILAIIGLTSLKF